ncbi:uncharacterized protein EV422DRAFT_598341, partial [Fimicolochytrium jonesii]|uniref:uncharacterized protein n=1 Tax=Fimicolochytrium jonesii TaxID=1396493 RepID=UPI0022FDC371
CPSSPARLSRQLVCGTLTLLLLPPYSILLHVTNTPLRARMKPPPEFPLPPGVGPPDENGLYSINDIPLEMVRGEIYLPFRLTTEQHIFNWAGLILSCAALFASALFFWVQKRVALTAAKVFVLCIISVDFLAVSVGLFLRILPAAIMGYHPGGFVTCQIQSYFNSLWGVLAQIAFFSYTAERYISIVLRKEIPLKIAKKMALGMWVFAIMLAAMFFQQPFALQVWGTPSSGGVYCLAPWATGTWKGAILATEAAMFVSSTGLGAFFMYLRVYRAYQEVLKEARNAINSKLMFTTHQTQQQETVEELQDSGDLLAQLNEENKYMLDKSTNSGKQLQTSGSSTGVLKTRMMSQTVVFPQSSNSLALDGDLNNIDVKGKETAHANPEISSLPRMEITNGLVSYFVGFLQDEVIAEGSGVEDEESSGARSEATDEERSRPEPSSSHEAGRNGTAPRRTNDLGPSSPSSAKKKSRIGKVMFAVEGGESRFSMKRPAKKPVDKKKKYMKRHNEIAHALARQASIIVIVYYIGLLPEFVEFIYNLWTLQPPVAWADRFAFITAMLYTVLNPVLFLALNQQYKAALKDEIGEWKERWKNWRRVAR